MSSWSSWSSWFTTSLPMLDFAVPSGIQRRFFSFLLRRTLGHFLKPGQLDLHQIDSQLGSGTVQVKDLELDGQVINQLLVGLPVTLYDGFISGVTARIPFPNPLSSTVGCHVQSLRLTFQVTPEQPISPFRNSTNLADSVVSVAETFIHDELTPREEAALRQTLNPTAGSSPLEDESDSLPGGFNPFGYNFNAEEARKEPREGDDPAGVSVFATLIERLLAKFEFSAADTKITIIYPGQASFTLSISEIAYHTDTGLRSEANGGLEPIPEGHSHPGQRRTVSISGFKVTSRDLRVVTPSSTVPSTLSPVSPAALPPSHRSPLVDQLSSYNSSSSSLDEATRLEMSQSIAMLPPGSPHLSSASNSMYQSAIATEDTHPTKVNLTSVSLSALQPADNIGHADLRPRISIPCHDSVEDVLLSFGSQPIVFSLQTPSHLIQPSERVLQAGGDHPANSEDFVGDKLEPERLRLSVTVGTLACALCSSHLRVLLDIMDACISKFPGPSPVSHKEAPKLHCAALSLQANVVIRGIVMIALPESAAGSLSDFYERPLVPPRLRCTYLRLFLDTLSVSLLFCTSSPGLSVSDAPQISSTPVDRSTSAKIIASDVSLFTFHASSADDLHVAMPMLITDHYLPTLRAAQHHRPSLTSKGPRDIKLPAFEVIDWTQAKLKGGSAKLSAWRLRNRAASGKTDKSRAPSRRSNDLSSPFTSSPSSEAEDRLSVPPAIEVSGRLAASSSREEISRTVDIKVAPLHLFFDLGTIFKEDLFVRFVDDVASAAIFAPRKAVGTKENQILHHEVLESDLDMEKDVEIQQVSPDARDGEAERKRLEILVLEDLNLSMDYRRIKTSKPRFSPLPPLHERKKTVPSEPKYNLCLTCPMIRVEVRCPPPPSRSARSGCVLFDLHGLTISNLFSTKSTLGYSEAKPSALRSSENTSDVVLSMRLQEILVAYSSIGDTVAHAILTLGYLPSKGIGPDTSTSALLSTETAPNLPPLFFVLRKSDVAKNSKNKFANELSITVHIPLVNLVMDKTAFDGLQCWADDVAQLVERSFTAPGSTTETASSHNPSLIGSRYFTQLRLSGAHRTDESVKENSNRQNIAATVVKISVAEVLLRFIVPRNGEFQHVRPFDISALDVSALLELKPEDKEECVLAGEIMDLRVADTSSGGDYLILILLQSPTRCLSSTHRPLVGCRMVSFAIPETTAKESRIKLSLWGFSLQPPLDSSLANDLAMFAKAPPGVFESVVPSDCTRFVVGIVDVSIHLRVPEHPGAAVLHLGAAELSTELAGNSSEPAFGLNISTSHVFLVDSIQDACDAIGTTERALGRGIDFWKDSGYALVAEISHSKLNLQANNTIVPPSISVLIERIGLQVHLCADTISALSSLIANMTRTPKDDTTVDMTPETPSAVIGDHEHNMTASLDEHAFRLVPEVGSAADMISDDLPANQDYLDASFGGLRELRDDDLEDFGTVEQTGFNALATDRLGLVSNVGGETVRILKPLSPNEHHFDTIPPDTAQSLDHGTTLRVRIHNSDIVLFLHDGFDWPRTRKTIEREVKEMRKRLARLRQLVSTGQTQEPINEATSTTLFNSFHIGLEQDLGSMDPDTLIAAIDDELDDFTETGTESSWEPLHPVSPGRPHIASAHVHGKRFTRSKGASIEIRLEGLSAEIDNYPPGEILASRTLILVRDLEILDHIKTSTWKKFLTDMRSDSQGNVRETGSNMARIELLSVRPSPPHPTEEARLRVKILPLRLYVDQDALDFFKKFFAFHDPDSPPAPDDGEKGEIYFQHAEVFSVDIKLDYKPRRVDYKALRDGRTIELMNFFHFDGAEMTLRHLTLHGITGWPRFFDTLNDLWTPDVKATQLVDVISGVAPIRSVVNVGSGVADLILLPIAQYKKDGRIVHGLQKGTKAFVQSTAMEAIKLGARLATGTQVILEQAESVLGGQFKGSVTAEALQIPYEDEHVEGLDEEQISRYAAQPTGLREGVQSAYRSLQRNLHSAAQTILAVPMEVYERSGNEGAVRAVVRAVPIAVLKPMIGASEAVSKTLMGLHNTLDPNIRLDNEAKYKHR